MHDKIEKLKKLKLLFVEDEEDLLCIISDALTKLEANFITTNNGLDAFNIVKKNLDIDVIITDINMPVLNGLEFIKKIRKENINIPIIVMSAHTEIEYINEIKKYEINEYLLKPFDFIKFIELITSMDETKNVIK